MSPDFIKKMQKSTKTRFRWDPKCSSEAVEISCDNRYLFLKEDTY